MFFSGGISLPFLASLSYLFIISYSWSHVCKIVFDRHFVFVREWGKWQGGAHLRCHFTVLHTGADNHVLLVKPERRVGMCLSQEEREAPQSQGCLSTHGRKVFQGGCKDRMLCFGMGRVYSFYLYRESDCDKTFFLCWANVLSDQRHILTHTHTEPCRFVLVVFLSPVMSDPLTSWTAAWQASQFFAISWSLLKLMSIKSVMPSNHLILCCPLLLLPSILPNSRVFSNESALHIRWPKYWSFSFSINPSNEYSGLISFRIDCFDLLALQRTLKSLLQHHSSKTSIIQCSTFFTVQLSHLYMTTGKTIALTRRTFVSKVMSLIFNMLSLS